MTHFTAYGKALAKKEPIPDITETGATAHMKACAYDAGIEVLLTGHDSSGTAFRRTARSVYGAFATARAAWGIERAWHVTESGKKRLIFIT